jgi:hypothetical protein
MLLCMHFCITNRKFWIVSVVACVLAVSAWLSHCLLTPSDESQIRRTIHLVDTFRSVQGRLPVSLSDVGMVDSENGPIYYQRESEYDYIIWMGGSLGESIIYESKTGQIHR